MLEAIVALTLLAGTGAALFSWLGTNLRAAGALTEASARAALQLRALEVLETVNPAKQPKGSITLHQFELTWTSRPVAPPRLSVPYAQQVRWQVGLYRTAVKATDTQTQASVEFEMEQVGLTDLLAGQPVTTTPAP